MRIVCMYAYLFVYVSVCVQIYISRAGDSRLLLVHEDWYLSEHNTGYIFMGPPQGSNGTLRVERQGGEIKKKREPARARGRARKRERERRSWEVRRCGWKKEKQGFGIDVIVSVRHPSHSSFLRVRSRAESPPPPPPATACRPGRKLPLTTGCLPFKLLFHLSSVSLPAFFHTQITILPPTPLSGLLTHPFLLPYLSLFFAATPPRRYASSDIYVHF